MENEKKLKLGLDIGTNSVGYALLDENNKIVRKNGHAFWGVRMFEESKDAKSRRGYRSNRRRLARRKYRLATLQNLFSEEIFKVDKTFFIRLNDSFFKTEDKTLKNTYNLFDDISYSDYDFNKEYPTIYHLRYKLLNTKEKVDIRFLYLAIAHILKYRGNFLIPGDEFKKSDFNQIKNIFKDINEIIENLKNTFEEKNDDTSSEDYFEIINIEDDVFFENLNKVMLETKGITNKKNELLKILGVNKKTLVNELIIPLLAGSTLNVSNLSIIKNDKYEKTTICLNVDNIEESQVTACNNIPILSSILSKLIDLKSITDFFYVLKLLNNKESISEAMMSIYDEHKIDLNNLKKFFKEFAKEKYDDVFKIKKGSKVTSNYPHYIGYDKINSKKANYIKECPRDEFYKYLKGVFKTITNEDANKKIEEFEQKMDDENFLLKQRTNKNGAIPMQLHLYELKKILENQKDNYDFLNTKDENGLTVIDKIIALFTFKVPYYCGPLALNNNSNFAWIERSNEKISPWNFENVVDIDKTAIKFIERMQKKCTYLKGDEDFCLPKASIIFSEYNCLSYLNKLIINGNHLDEKIKEEIFKGVFLIQKQPTRKKLLEFIKTNYGNTALTTNAKEIPEVNCNMSSYIDMKNIFGDDFEKHENILEDIIKDITVFEDKKVLEKRLQRYNLPKEIIKKLKGLNYTKYSSLCMKLLNGLNVENEHTGEVYGTVLDVMRHTNLNLQEILYNDGYNFIKIIEEYNKKFYKDFTKLSVEEFLDEYVSVSPIFKRPLIQSYRIIQEIEHILQRRIDEFYIESTRTNTAKKTATNSRYETLKELYKNCKDDVANISELNEELENNKNNLKSDLLYLYFTQLGKCMYSLEPIDINDLINNNKFDIDHIYPQSIIKDDSLSNRVLVKKHLNNIKQDKFLYEVNVLNKDSRKFYDYLYEKSLIKKEKYVRLTEKEIPANKLDGFVSRQLVSTNQAVAGLKKLLIDYRGVEETKIIYSKGENVTVFRKKFDLVKSRTANNFHHAHDAYLNVIVGELMHKYYSYRNFKNHIDIQRIKNDSETLNIEKLFEKEIIKNGNKTIWDKNQSIAQIKHNLYERFDISETFRTYNSNEMFPKITILPASNDNLIPIKTTDPRKDTSKYGGLKSYSFSKYTLIEATFKNKRFVVLEAIPKIYENNITQYLLSQEYQDIKVLVENIKTNCIIKQENRKFVLTGKTGNQFVLKNINDRFFNYKEMVIIKKIDKYFENINQNIQMASVDEIKIIVSPARSNKNNEISLTIEEVNYLLESIKKMYSKDIYNFSTIQNLITFLNEKIDLNLKEKIELINELLKLLKTNERKTIDLSLLKQSKNFGTLLIGNKLSKGTKIIIESYTGYYKKVLYEV